MIEEYKEMVQALKDLIEFFETRKEKLHSLALDIFSHHLKHMVELKEICLNDGNYLAKEKQLNLREIRKWKEKELYEKRNKK